MFKAKYFVTHISCIEYAPKRFIDQDMETIKGLVGEEEQDNIGSMAANERILNMIRTEEKKREERERREGGSGNEVALILL